MGPKADSWHREAVGGLWEEIGQLQYDFLIVQGLRSDHYFLDIACGSLRAGVKLIPYLEAGHYYGIDKDAELIRRGFELELTDEGRNKHPVLVEMEDFEFARLGRQFDLAMAQSLFTHLSVNQITRCLMNAGRALRPGGVLYATFFENERGKTNLAPIEWPTRDGLIVTTHFDRDPYHYDVSTFEWICAGTGFSVGYVGDWRHPRSQRMLSFTRKG